MARTTKKASTKKSGPKFADLNAAERMAVTRRIKAAVTRSMFGAGKYNIVSSSKYQRLRERPGIEIGGEDDALASALRMQMINLARNGVRNNETLNAILRQFELNVVGTVGGKAYFDFEPEFADQALVLREAFAKWASECEFFDGMNFRDFLCIALRTMLIGGDLVVVFDDHEIENSGRLAAYEPDSIGDVSQEIFDQRFGSRGWTQRQGRIYNRSSRFIGVTVSSAERGSKIFKDPEACITFLCDPNNRRAAHWTMLRDFWRFNQGRGTPPVAAPLGSILDVQALQGYEVESAKKNAQTYAQLIQTAPEPNGDPNLANPAENADTVFDESSTEAEIDAAVAETGMFEEAPVTFDELTAAGAMYDVMPANAKLELLDTKHPNANMNEFIAQVAARGGWSMALSRMFVTGRVESSYSGFRGEQLLSQPMFDFMAKKLEGFQDWVLAKWFDWATFEKQIPNLHLPENWKRQVKWFHPLMREANPVDAQNAWNAGLKNGTITYDDIIGPDWREKLARAGRQKEFCESINFIHPSSETVSGQVVEAPQTTNADPAEGPEEK